MILAESNEDDRGIYEALLAFLGLTVVRADQSGDVHAIAGDGIVRSASELEPALIVVALDRVELQHHAVGSAATFPALIRALKRAPQTRGTPILALTTSVDPEFCEELCAAGAAAVVRKPAPLHSIATAVVSLLQGDVQRRCRAAAANLSA